MRCVGCDTPQHVNSGDYALLYYRAPVPGIVGRWYSACSLECADASVSEFCSTSLPPAGLDGHLKHGTVVCMSAVLSPVQDALCDGTWDEAYDLWSQRGATSAGVYVVPSSMVLPTHTAYGHYEQLSMTTCVPTRARYRLGSMIHTLNRSVWTTVRLNPSSLSITPARTRAFDGRPRTPAYPTPPASRVGAVAAAEAGVGSTCYTRILWAPPAARGTLLSYASWDVKSAATPPAAADQAPPATDPQPEHSE